MCGGRHGPIAVPGGSYGAIKKADANVGLFGCAENDYFERRLEYLFRVASSFWAAAGAGVLP
jgi:hypothetical protein